MTHKRGKEISHVAFKSDALEAVVNYYGEHAYLMKIKKGINHFTRLFYKIPI
jgi:hypothetical protein